MMEAIGYGIDDAQASMEGEMNRKRAPTKRKHREQSNEEKEKKRAKHEENEELKKTRKEEKVELKEARKEEQEKIKRKREEKPKEIAEPNAGCTRLGRRSKP